MQFSLKLIVLRNILGKILKKIRLVILKAKTTFYESFLVIVRNIAHKTIYLFISLRVEYNGSEKNSVFCKIGLQIAEILTLKAVET